VEPEPAAFADALERVISDDGLRDRLSSAGLERSAGFSWERTARRTDALLGNLLA
jgi:D-inositol-3-phosphate glycosyltransferase